jgi:hypothetical protein
MLDMGGELSFATVELYWENAYGKRYDIDISDDGETWTTTYSETNGSGGVEVVDLSGNSGRYIRMYGLERGSGYGYSLFEFKVSGDPTPAPAPVSPTPSAPVSPTPPAPVLDPTPAPVDLTPTPVLDPTPAPALDTTPAPVAPNPPLQVVTAIASSNKRPAENVIDESMSTRWESDYSDPQWLMLDMGGEISFSTVELYWEAAYGKSYDIDISDDGETWTTVYSETNGSGGVEVIDLSGNSGRYIRMYGLERGSGYGYSLFEFKVSRDPTPAPVNPTPPAPVFDATSTPVDPTPAPVLDPTPAPAAPTPALQVVTALASSNIRPAENAIDESMSTRWESDYSDPQWLMLDMGGEISFAAVELYWEAAYGKSYDIDISDDGETWTTAYSETNGSGGVEVIDLSGSSGRYIRMYGVERGSGYGYSLFEFKVSRDPSPARAHPVNPTPAPVSPTPPAPVFDPTRAPVAPTPALQVVTELASSNNPPAENAIDESDPQWLMLDMGGEISFTTVEL